MNEALGAAVDPLFDPAVVEDPFAYYARLRELDPVHKVKGTGAFLVTRMDLVQEVIADPTTYSSETIKFLHLDRHGRPELWSASSRRSAGLRRPDTEESPRAEGTKVPQGRRGSRPRRVDATSRRP